MTKMNCDPNKVQTPVTVIFNSSNAASRNEVRFLNTRNEEGKLAFVDLVALDVSATDYGVSAEAVKAQLHARDAAGHIFVGIDALYAAHVAIGLAKWFEMCRLPGFLSVGTGIGSSH
jgi:predicted DCC family thiol-disulfide oxidoreductase YuxK